MAFSRLDSTTHDCRAASLIGVLLMATFIVAERLGHFIEQPMSNRIFDIAMYRFCSTITGNLAGRRPSARPAQGDTTLDEISPRCRFRGRSDLGTAWAAGRIER